jgi:hypothetical protein
MGTKQCPQCAEQIQTLAKKCRFCGYQFSEAHMAMAEARQREANIIGTATKALPIVLILAFVWFCSNQPTSPSAMEQAATVTDPKPCNDLIEQAQREGLIKERPSPERINVDDRLWAEFPAGSKRGLALAVRCSATRGAPRQLDYGVVYGYRSGKRLAMATSVGVEFE